MNDQLAENTDRELWRKTPGDFYAPSLHVTADGKIGINVGGTVHVRTIEDWHAMASYHCEAVRSLYQKFKAEEHDNKLAQQIFRPENWTPYHDPTTDQSATPEKLTDFQRDLQQLINQHSLENQSDTPDFILARFLQESLAALNTATQMRQKWWGHKTFNHGITTLESQSTPQPAPNAG